MVILAVELEVPGQIPDAVAQKRDLHFGRARIRRVLPVRLHDLTRALRGDRHPAFSVSFVSRCTAFSL